MNAITDRPPPFHTPRKRTLSLYRESDIERERRRAKAEEYPTDVRRPVTRADCLNGGSNAERPCPFVSCSHHLLLEEKPREPLRMYDAKTGKRITVHRPSSVLLAFGHEDPERLVETCSLDVAERGGATLEEVGDLVGVTKERARQIEESALRKAGVICKVRGAKENW